jgi:hypothetical protein
MLTKAALRRLVPPPDVAVGTLQGRRPSWLRCEGARAGRQNRLNVVGGTQESNGVAGKVLVHRVKSKVDKLHFDLVR